MFRSPFPLPGPGASPEVLGPAIAYHTTHEWGAVGVSEEAHRAYDLTPLESVVDGPAPKKLNNAFGPVIDVRILGPTELATAEEGTIISHGYHLTPRRVTYGIAISGDTEAIKQEHNDAWGASQDIPGAGLFSDLFEDEPEVAQTAGEGFAPLEEALPQIILHTLLPSMSVGLGSALSEHEHMTTVNAAYRKLGVTVVSGLVSGVGLVAGTSVVEGRLSPAGVTMAALTELFTGVVGMRQARDLATARPSDDIALRRAQVVTLEMHHVFCSTHFNMEQTKFWHT